MDSRVEEAIAHWSPRFVSTGVLLSDFNEVTSAIPRWQDWCAAWCARAQTHEAIGMDALGRGYRLSAGELLSRAALYYHFAKFVFVNDLDEMRAAHIKAVECRRLALPHLAPCGERIQIPFEGKRLVGNLRKPPGTARPPVVIMVPGLDSAKEELETYELPFLARGMATLLVDGPGQGEGEYEFPIRGDYENAATAIVDWIHGRDDLDAARIGMWGVSLGGYYAPRSSAYEKRIRACIGLSGPYDFGECWSILPQLTRDVFRVRSKCSTDAEAESYAHTLSLAQAAKHIECPMLLVAGKQDRLIPWQHTERLAQETRAPVDVIMVGDGNHVVNNRPHRYRVQSADWMAGHLGLPTA